jgi:Glycosyl hydrolases family 15
MASSCGAQSPDGFASTPTVAEGSSVSGRIARAWSQAGAPRALRCSLRLLDEVADPILLAWQLGYNDAETWEHVERAAGCILARGPTSQERWENAEGYSPATIAAEIAALVCAADIADRNGEAAAAAIYRDVADRWQGAVEGWTRTSNGPLSDQPYYLRLTIDGNADAGTAYTIGDGGPTIDQRRVVDTSFLELVRLGVKPADDRDIRATLPVVDRELGVDTPTGGSGTATTTTATARLRTAGRSQARATPAGSGPCSPASGASTSSPRASARETRRARGARPGPTWRPSPRRQARA